ncbi:hypothetical protein GKQ77_17770 [Streptomyces sp. BG9H]|uniref:Chitinase n=1 Tax=Streptomyces anatolicus TaxID=2675858 RepID=A0ABS6YPP5_9ACTN|nr:hypothetical protein [Streptomyces anatolicus]MBW5423393.1 hypothetical protein [Streptomyces anatolicus]
MIWNSVRPHAAVLGVIVAMTAVSAAPAQAGPAPAAAAEERLVAHYHSKSGCLGAGAQGKRKGKWAHYRCLPSWDGPEPWGLWVS